MPVTAKRTAEASTAGARTVLLASPRSFCAGVERAIAIVEQLLAARGGPIYVRKQIVHNTHVVADLQARGTVFVDELDAVPDGATVVFSAHGVSPAVRTAAADRGLEVIDATCPLVTKVHAEARRFAARGDTVVLIGHAGHEEVEGTLGEAPDQTVLVQTANEVAHLEVADPDRVSYLTQTTLAVDETTEIIAALRARFPALREPASDDICYATTNRQDALTAITEESELVLVVGSTNSSNSLRLVELARRHGRPSYLIDDPTEIRPEWLEGVRVVGLTAGASAPPQLIDAVIAALRQLGPLTVIERETTRETVHFTLPPRGTPTTNFPGEVMTAVELGMPRPPSPPALPRRASRQVMVGAVPVGGGAPISVQSMTTTRTSDIDATLQQIAELTAAGCQIVRVAVPSQDDADALPAIAAKSPIPVIADIHFQPRYVFAALDAGCAAVRVNPGNIKKFDDKIKQIARAARDVGVPIRIGVNAGSLDPRLLAKHGRASAEALVESALWECSLFEEHGFRDIKISVKHHDPLVVIAAYRQLALRCDYPLHLGVTEAGPLLQGTVKSAIAFGVLLAEGIGDTIRVSLSAPPVEEVKIGSQILESLGLRPRRLEIVSCPSCGRAQVDVHTLAEQVTAAFEGFEVPLRIAVMGCVVNGPGEAREADLGVSAGNGKGQIFVRGTVIKTVPEHQIVRTLLEEAHRRDWSHPMTSRPAE